MDTTMTRHSRRRYVLFGALATLAITILMAVYSGPRIEAAMTHPTLRQSDRWFLETRTQPLVRDRWYVEAATQPAARDRWYIEAKAQPLAYGSTDYRADRANFHSVARDYAPYMYRLVELNMMEDPAAGELPARDRWYIEAAAQPVAYDRWYLDMPGAREHSIK